MFVLFTLVAVIFQDGAAAEPAKGARSVTTVQPSAASTPAARGSDKLVCRKEQETGSLLGGHKICRTQVQWDQMARESQDTVNAVTLAGNHRH